MGKFKVKTDKQTYNQVRSLLLESGFRISAPTGKDWIIGELGGVISSYSNWNNNPPDWFYDIKEITLPELRAMVKPMKEYLDKQEDGTYKLIKTDGGCVDRDWIEIPEGAEVATICRNYIIFWRDERYSFSVSEENKWCYKSCDDSRYFSLGEYMNEYGDTSIIWQREQDEPFLTPECTLNDQYAEIEKVRQTLNERQSQYGSFKDVADTTQKLMDQFALGRMSNVQREALHMICSKLARIANGDPNHVDSWHDIAGYATLVVDDLES